MWENVVELLVERMDIKFKTQYSNYERWFTSLKNRECVKKALGMRAKGIQDNHPVRDLSKV